MKALRVLVLTHEDLVPPTTLAGLEPKEVMRFQKEFDVAKGLRELGHEVRILGVSHDLLPIRTAVEEFRPHAVFHLLMEFQDVAVYQAHVVSYLELLRVPYAGCNPRGLLIARDKALSKKIFRYHRIPAPAFTVFRHGRAIRVPHDVTYPRIVKSVDEEASLGISQASVVHDEEKLRERVAFVHRRLGTDAIAEQYIAGRELTVSVIGNERLQTFPIWELFFDNLHARSKPIATERVKWNRDYQLRSGIATGPAEDLPDALARHIERIAKRTYRALGLSGYARVDLRLSDDGRVWVLEANPNPDLRNIEDFAASAEEAGISYPQLLQRIVSLGIRYRSPWRKVEEA